MSIPKEPRQLMINLMYLVLTAMLALNVSAEIINAFFSLNKGIKDSSTIVDGSNTNIKVAIDKQAKAYPKSENIEFQSLSEKAQKISKEFENYINGITGELVTAAGGLNPKYTDGRPIRYKDKDVTTNLFLPGGKNKGVELEQKVRDTRAAFLALIKDPKERDEMAKQVALLVDSIPADSKAKTWSELKFKQMPVAAVMPTLTKLSADAKTSETAILNYFFKKINGEVDIKFDKFKVAIAPKKAYLIRGDKFEADVYLAAYSSMPGNNVSISVNGTGVGLKEGVGHYETTPSTIGKQTVNANASIRNPLTGQVTNSTGTFEYEVGEKSGTISAEKMNVFYMGVENPVAISAAGVSSNSLRLNCTGCQSLNKVNDNNYVVKIDREGEVALTMTGEGGFSVVKKFRGKRIPNPVPMTSFQGRGGPATTGQMMSFTGMLAILENFDFDAKCSIQSYILFRAPRREDPQQVNVSGFTNPEAERVCRMAKPGDQYQFMEIKARCPGDAAARNLGSMGFVVR